MNRNDLRRIWSQRGAWSVALGLVLSVTVVHAAAADAIGQAPPAFTWIEIKDSRGLSAWVYEMSLDRGGIIAPDKFFWSAVVDFCWSLYWGGVVLAIWFLDWVLSFEWVKLIATPMIGVGDALQGVIDRFGLVPTLLTITALVAVLVMARGRWATGIWDLAVALVIAALASGLLAQPLQLVAGTDGLIYSARNWGFELAAALSGGGSGQSLDAAAMRQQLTGQMVDTFVRQPAQMINFGQILDGGRCESAYNDVLKGGPHGLEPTIRQAVGGCDQALGDYAANPASGMASGAFLFSPAALVILLLAVVLAGTVLLAGVNVLWQALKAIVNLVLGLLPGGTRGSLLLTISEAVMSLILLGFSTIFLAVFMSVVQSLFTGAAGNEVARAFVITDVVLVIGLLVFIKTKKRLQAAAHRLAKLMALRPGSGARPTRIPESVNSGLAAAAGKAAGLGLSLAYLGRTLKQPQPTRQVTLPVPAVVGPSERTVFSGSSDRPTPPSSASTQGPAASPSAPGGPLPPLPAGRTAAGALGGPVPAGTAPGPSAAAGTAPASSAAKPEFSGPVEASSATGSVEDADSLATGPGGPDGAPAARRPPRIAGGLARVAARKLVGGTLKLGAKAGLAYLSGGASAAVTAAMAAARARRAVRLPGSGSRLALAQRLAPPVHRAGPVPPSTAAAAAERAAAGAVGAAAASSLPGRRGNETPLPKGGPARPPTSGAPGSMAHSAPVAAGKESATPPSPQPATTAPTSTAPTPTAPTTATSSPGGPRRSGSSAAGGSRGAPARQRRRTNAEPAVGTDAKDDVAGPGIAPSPAPNAAPRSARYARRAAARSDPPAPPRAPGRPTRRR